MYLKNSKIAPLDWYILVLGSCVKSTLWRELNDRFQDYTYSIEMRGGRTLMNFCCRNGPKYIVSKRVKLTCCLQDNWFWLRQNAVVVRMERILFVAAFLHGIRYR